VTNNKPDKNTVADMALGIFFLMGLIVLVIWIMAFTVNVWRFFF